MAVGPSYKRRALPLDMLQRRLVKMTCVACVSRSMISTLVSTPAAQLGKSGHRWWCRISES